MYTYLIDTDKNNIDDYVIFNYENKDDSLHIFSNTTNILVMNTHLIIKLEKVSEHINFINNIIDILKDIIYKMNCKVRRDKQQLQQQYLKYNLIYDYDIVFSFSDEAILISYQKDNISFNIELTIDSYPKILYSNYNRLIKFFTAIKDYLHDKNKFTEEYNKDFRIE